MATVYIWGQLGLTGHASVEFCDRRGYLSFHPLDSHLARQVTGSPGILSPYKDDVEQHRPSNTIQINWLDEDAMASHFNDLHDDVRSERQLYQLFGANCSSMAVQLLMVGAGLQFSPHKTMGQVWSAFSRFPFRHDHGRVAELVRELTEDMALVCARRGVVGPLARYFLPILLAADVASRTFVWTPGDVKSVANDLSKHNHR